MITMFVLWAPSCLEIFMPQLFSLIYSFCSASVSEVSMLLLAGMIVCGIGGGIAGRALNVKIESGMVNRLFIGLISVICLICLYNIFR